MKHEYTFLGDVLHIQTTTHKPYQRISLIFKRFGLWLLVAMAHVSSPLRAAPNCLNDLANFNNPTCTANDVSTAVVNVISGPSVCVNGTTIYVELQANTIAGSNVRYDIGYFIALDGGDAKTGQCYQDYLPPPLNITPTVGLTRTSPFFNEELAVDPADTCGDLEQNITNLRNIGGIPVSSGTPGPPLMIGILCQDTNSDNIADVSVCTSWANQNSNGGTMPSCTSVAGTIPETPSKCSCVSLKVGAIIYKSLCSTNSDCNDNNACTADSCDTQTGTCSNIAIGAGTVCDDGNLCTTNDVCGGAGNVICAGTPVVCTGLEQCFTCNFDTGACTTPLPDTTPCDDGMTCTISDTCTNGVCSGIDDCPQGQICVNDQCITPQCTDASQCDDLNPCTDNACINGSCVYTNNTAPCNDGNACTQNDTCLNGSCQPGTPVICNTPGTCQVNPGLCSAGNCNYPSAGNGTSCGTNMVCQGGLCIAVQCITNFQCYDGNPCTNDACISGNCVYTNNTEPCDDYDACTEDDRCFGGICQAGTLITCTDPGICELSPGTCSGGECEYPPAHDGTPCGANKTCYQGKCIRAPIIAKAFNPIIIREGAKSTLTITLSNPNSKTAQLTSPLIDILPAGMAIAGSASTTCAGRLTAINGTNELALTQGSIPANGSCTINVKVSTCEEGSFTNTLPAGALRTNKGSNALPATATLTVSCESCLD